MFSTNILRPFISHIGKIHTQYVVFHTSFFCNLTLLQGHDAVVTIIPNSAEGISTAYRHTPQVRARLHLSPKRRLYLCYLLILGSTPVHIFTIINLFRKPTSKKHYKPFFLNIRRVEYKCACSRDAANVVKLKPTTLIIS